MHERIRSDDTPTPTGKRVLVTGGAGFVGSHLARTLAPDNEVRVIDDLSSGQAATVPDGVEFVEGDLRDPDALDAAMSGVDVVFHQAGMVSVPESVEHPQESHARNATATLALLERARREDARVVAASSVAIYGHPESVPVDEDHPVDPTTPYGVDKLALDAYVRLYNDLYGLETVALRYFNVYGPGQGGGHYSGVIDVFMEQALSGQSITVEGDGEQTRDFVHVSDVVRANLAAARTDHVGRAFNVGTGESTSINDLARAVQSATGLGTEVVHVDARPDDIRRSRADISRARERLGFDPRIDLETGLTDLVPQTYRAGTD
jgi:UDP-glucose 4-epimerase